MALGDPYATEEELRTRLRDDASNLHPAELNRVLGAVTSGINLLCRRQFQQTTTASARIFYPETDCRAVVHDFHTTAGLIIATDEDDDGTYETTWTSSEYQLEPLNGIVDGETGWPFWVIIAVNGRRFPTNTRRAPLQTTAQWGWAAVPPAVKEACLVVSGETASLPEAKFGVASSAEWGVARVRANPMAMDMLKPYRLNPVLVG